MEETKKTREIDIVGILKKVLSEKKLLLRFVAVFFVLGVIVALSKPKTYTAEVVLAPEISSGGLGLSESLSDMASNFGVDLGTKPSYDAIYPEIYPNVFSSTDFIMALFDVPVRKKNSDETKTYLYHITKERRVPFWNYPKLWLTQMLKSKKAGKGNGKRDPFRLSEGEYGVCNYIRGAISCQVDKKTSIITVSITDQDPLTAAIMADTLQHRLQEYIASYRTQKARNDFNYYQKLCAESKKQYLQAQQAYAGFADANQDVVMESIRAKQNELENEMQLRYNVYNQVSAQLQNARAKIQERTPAFTIVEKSTMPYEASSTPRSLVVIFFVFLAVWPTRYGFARSGTAGTTGITRKQHRQRMMNALPYILLIFLLGVAAFLYDNTADGTRKKNIVIVSVAVFFIFFGFRGFILSDWINYYPFFYSSSFYDIEDYQFGAPDSWEPGFTLLNLLCKAIFDDYFFFQFVCCLIDTALLLNFFRKRVSNIPFALMLYIVFEGLVLSTNLMRNSIAIFLFLNALPYLEKRQPLQYFGICLLAATFHTTALLFLPLYFLFKVPINKWVFLGIFVACNIVYICHVSIFLNLATMLGLDEQFAGRIKIYTDYFSKASTFSIGYLERLFTGALVFLYFDKLKEVRKENVVFINALILYFIVFFCFSEFQVLSRRFSYLFVFSYWILWIDLVKCFAIENNKKLFVGFVFVYCLLRIGGSTYLPDFKYENILFGSSSYQERLYMHNKTFVEQ